MKLLSDPVSTKRGSSEPYGYHQVVVVFWDGNVKIDLLLVVMGRVELYRGAPCEAQRRELNRPRRKPGMSA